MSITIGVINQKGGVAKTTTALNLAAGIARKGHDVLLVDLDPQGNSTYCLGVGLDGDEMPTIADVLGEGRLTMEDVIVDTGFPHLKLAPADISLFRAAALMNTKPFRESLLNKALAPLGTFEYIIIDAQPSLELLPLNVIVASSKFVIPTQPTALALKGLTDILTTVQSMKNGEPYDWRILLTMVSGHAKERQGRAAHILEPIRERVLKTQIRRNEAIELSQMENDADEIIPIVLHKKWSKGAGDYRALVQEVLELWPA